MLYNICYIYGCNIANLLCCLLKIVFFNVYVLCSLWVYLCYVTNFFCCILGYIGTSVYYINCYVTCYILYCVGILKNYIAIL